jgi:uncharacterized protein
MTERISLIREWYEQMNAGDIPGAVAKLHPAVEWIEAEHSPYGWPGPPLVGVAAVQEAVWLPLARDWEELRVVPESFEPLADRVLVEGRYVGRHARTGAELDAQVIHVWTVGDGVITRYQGFADTYALHRALEPPAERNKVAARTVFDVWSSGELERLDSLVARNVVHHDPQDPNAADGLDGMKRTIARTREAFPDIRLTVEQQLAEGDAVATRWSGSMTATDGGQRAFVSGITIDRFDEGVIVEAWRSYRVDPGGT